MIFSPLATSAVTRAGYKKIVDSLRCLNPVIVYYAMLATYKLQLLASLVIKEPLNKRDCTLERMNCQVLNQQFYYTISCVYTNGLIVLYLGEMITTADIAKETGLRQRTIQKRIDALRLVVRRAGKVMILTRAQADKIATMDSKPGPKRKR